MVPDAVSVDKLWGVCYLSKGAQVKPNDQYARDGEIDRCQVTGSRMLGATTWVLLWMPPSVSVPLVASGYGNTKQPLYVLNSTKIHSHFCRDELTRQLAQ